MGLTIALNLGPKTHPCSGCTSLASGRHVDVLQRLLQCEVPVHGGPRQGWLRKSITGAVSALACRALRLVSTIHRSQA